MTSGLVASGNAVLVQPAKGVKEVATRFRALMKTAKAKGMNLIPESHIGTAIIKVESVHNFRM